MIPRLYGAGATDFTNLGITTLTDCISCEVTEERNGIFELEMVVATTTPYYTQLQEGCIILAKPNHTQTPQAFEIYEVTRPINQRVTVRANHISYRQSFVPVKPFSATGITATLQGLLSNAQETSPFTFSTDITNETSTYNQLAPASLRSRLGGVQGSLLDVFGGEYVWDNFNTQLLLHRGADNGVQLRLGKNIVELEQTVNLERVVTGALPFWQNEDGSVVFYGDIQYSSNVGDYAIHRTVVLDLSDEYDTAPTQAELENDARLYLAQASLGTPANNIKVSFVDLADTTEYMNSPLERVNLCDTVEVICPELNIDYKAKAIKVVFDVLAERTLEVEIGEAKSTITQTINDLVGDVSEVIQQGKKTYSITQQIDRELGQIINTVGSVEEGTGLAGQVVYNTTQINQMDNKITQTVSQEINSRDLPTKSYVSSEISQAVDNITITISQITDLPEEVTELSTYFSFENNGLFIGKSDSDIRALYDNDSVQFIDKNNTALAWLDATDGLGANKVSIGDPAQTNRWQWIVSDDGSHSRFTRHL